MISKLIANRYAKALHQAIPSKEEVIKHLDYAVTLVTSFPKLMQFLLAPQIKRQNKEEVLRKLFAPQTDPRFLKFIFLLTQKRRIKDLPSIAKSYQDILAKESHTLNTTVITAVALDNNLRDKVQNMLEKSFRKKITLSEKIDSSIIGGMILLTDHQMFDASIQSQLMSLKGNLLNSTI